MIDLLGLHELADRTVETYSSGQKMKLAFGKALINDAPLLVLDEPTNTLDVPSASELRAVVRELNAAGKTVIYTTHIMSEAESLCDRVAIMDQGKILALDTLDNLLSEYGGLSVVTGELTSPPADDVQIAGTIDGTSVRFESSQPLQEVGRLSSAGVEFRTLHVNRPDLETVFLGLTGRSLRDQ